MLELCELKVVKFIDSFSLEEGTLGGVVKIIFRDFFVDDEKSQSILLLGWFWLRRNVRNARTERVRRGRVLASGRRPTRGNLRVAPKNTSSHLVSSGCIKIDFFDFSCIEREK